MTTGKTCGGVVTFNRDKVLRVKEMTNERWHKL